MKRLLGVLLILPNLSFAGAITYRCSFTSYCSLEEGCNPTEFDLRFEYDTLTGTAFLRGNNGVADVAAIKGSDGISFLELLQTGAVQSTTISINNSAVHSRNSIIAGELLPSQYFGNCQVEES